MRNNNNTKRKNGRWKQPSGGVPHKKEAGFRICGLNSEKKEHYLKIASGSDKVIIKRYTKGKFRSRWISPQKHYRR